MASLRQKQSKFVKMKALLILYAYELGYELTDGHAYRCADCKVGAKRSLHKIKLAQDYNLFKNGRYLKKTKSYESLGVFWESIGGTWGGRWNDGGHFSLAHGGRK